MSTSYAYLSLFLPQIQMLFFNVLLCLIFVLWNLGSLVVNYPYDDDKKGETQYSQSPDDEVFKQVSRAYSEVTGHCWICFRLE